MLCSVDTVQHQINCFYPPFHFQFDMLVWLDQQLLNCLQLSPWLPGLKKHCCFHPDGPPISSPELDFLVLGDSVDTSHLLWASIEECPQWASLNTVVVRGHIAWHLRHLWWCRDLDIITLSSVSHSVGHFRDFQQTSIEWLCWKEDLESRFYNDLYHLVIFFTSEFDTVEKG